MAGLTSERLREQKHLLALPKKRCFWKELDSEKKDGDELAEVVAVMARGDRNVALEGFKHLISMLHFQGTDSRHHDALMTPENREQFAKYLANEKDEEMQEHAADVVACLASGRTRHCIKFYKQLILPRLMGLLGGRPNSQHVLLALGRLADGDLRVRNALGEVMLAPLMDILRNHEEGILLKSALFCLSVLTRDKFLERQRIFDFLPPMLEKRTDTEELGNICWGMRVLLEAAKDECTPLVVRKEVCSHLVSLLDHPNDEVLESGLATLIAICESHAESKQTVLECSLLQALHKLLIHHDTVHNQTCELLAALMDGNEECRDEVVKSGMLLPLRDIFSNGEDYTRDQAISVLLEATVADTCLVQSFLEQGFIQPLCDLLRDLLSSSDLHMLHRLLCAIDSVLCVGSDYVNVNMLETPNANAREFEAFGGLEIVKNLQDHSDKMISEAAIDIVDTFFPDDNDEPMLF